jgi:Na+/H+ antiporter NhaD/arsenite permease-like protein
MFLVFFNLRVPEYGLIVVILVYIISFRDVLKKANWSLIVLFILMFIDLRAVAQIPAVTNFFTLIGINRPENLFITSILSSQVISNVPAAILLTEYSRDWLIIAYGVNVGGNGIIIGSLANIIALRFIRDKKIWMTFHIYSIAFCSLLV